MCMIGIIPAAGYATRVSSLINGKQKASVVVEWNGERKPLVCHQIDFLRKCGVEDVVVVIGYRPRDVFEAIEKYGYRWKVKFVVDSEILGLGNVWRVVSSYFSTKEILSLNSDDLMYSGTEEIVMREVGNGCGVVFGVVKEGMGKTKSTYQLDEDGYIVKCMERGGDEPYVGCGLYYVLGDVSKTVGLEPGDVINELIEMKKVKYKFVDIVKWYDAGSAEGLQKIMKWEVSE